MENKKYVNNGKSMSASDAKESLKFYLENALGTPYSIKNKLPEDIRCKVKGVDLLATLNNILDTEKISSSVIEHECGDDQQLSRYHKKQTATTKWIVDYSPKSRVVVKTKQTSHYPKGIDTSFSVKYQHKLFLGYKTNASLTATRKINDEKELPSFKYKIKNESKLAESIGYASK